jgi:hypothetical protein
MIMATTVELDETRAFSAVGRRGPLSVEVLEGTVHVTIEGDPLDRILESGEVVVSERGRRVAATGLASGRVRVTLLERPRRRFGLGGGEGFVRHLLGAALIVTVWVSLWTWVTVGVVAPLSVIVPRPAAVEHANRS